MRIHAEGTSKVRSDLQIFVGCLSSVTLLTIPLIVMLRARSGACSQRPSRQGVSLMRAAGMGAQGYQNPQKMEVGLVLLCTTLYEQP
jgi:hypothetical protein